MKIVFCWWCDEQNKTMKFLNSENLITLTTKKSQTMSTQSNTETSTKIQTAENELQQLENSDARYLAYTARIRTALVAAAKNMPRMSAYTSEIGEAGRPILPPWMIKFAYGISWAYVIGDVSLATVAEIEKGSETNIVVRTATKQALFQSTASMILPAFTVHQTVHWSDRLLKKMQIGGRLGKFGPTGIGLAIIPALPFMFDHPIEHLYDLVYEKVWPLEK